MNGSLKFWLLGALALTLVGCGRELSGRRLVNGNVAPPTVYSYQFEMGTCSTGRHSTDDFTTFCNTLRDDAQNFNCASYNRQQDFYTSRCPGTF